MWASDAAEELDFNYKYLKLINKFLSYIRAGPFQQLLLDF